MSGMKFRDLAGGSTSEATFEPSVRGRPRPTQEQPPCWQVMGQQTRQMGMQKQTKGSEASLLLGAPSWKLAVASSDARAALLQTRVPMECRIRAA